MFRNTETKRRWFLKEPDLPVIAINMHAYNMSMAYVDCCSDEIGWLCHITKTSSGVYLIDECFLPKQEVGAATCEFTEEGLSEFMMNVIANKGIDYYNEIRCWAHSHVNMSARPSGQDSKQILEWKDSDYQIMLIVNKKGEFYAEFYDFKNQVAFNNLSVELYNPDKEHYIASAKEQIAECVSKHVSKFEVKLDAVNNKVGQLCSQSKDGSRYPTVKTDKTEDIASRFAHNVYRTYQEQKISLIDLFDVLTEECSIKTLEHELHQIVDNLSKQEFDELLERIYYDDAALEIISVILEDAFATRQACALINGVETVFSLNNLRMLAADYDFNEIDLMRALRILPLYLCSEDSVEDIVEYVTDYNDNK